MGSLRSLRNTQQERPRDLQSFINSEPELPDLSVAEAKARQYSFDLTRYRIVRILEIQDCYCDVLFKLLGRIDIRSSDDMDVQYYLSDNEIDWVACGLRDEGGIEYIEGLDTNGKAWFGYTLVAENSLTARQRQVLQTLWGEEGGLSLREPAISTDFHPGYVADIIEELKADNRVVEGQRGQTPVWTVVI